LARAKQTSGKNESERGRKGERKHGREEGRKRGI
jgi:hypothetical protein